MTIATIKACAILVIGLLLCLFSVPISHAQATNFPRSISRTPLGINESLWLKTIPKNNRMSSRKVALGRALFFDKRLSIDGTVSCATCHDPALAFTDSRVVAMGAANQGGTRNAPTLLNAVFNESFFWDGRAPSLEDQVKQPIISPFEMGMGSAEQIISRLSSIPEYQRQFKQVFEAEGLALDTIAKAVAAYERTLLSGNSPFDRFIRGSGAAITEAQKRGWELFKGKAKCIECHNHSQSSPFFTDFKFHNTGVAASYALFDKLVASVASSRAQSVTMMAHSTSFSELGRFVVTLQQADIGSFKTPTLRDAELTSPYMHDGSLKTLIDVVQFYNRGGNPNSHLDKLIHPLVLTDDEVNDLVQFMRALTSDEVLRLCQTTNPQTRDPVPVK